MNNLPTKITIKLYPIEYAALLGFLQRSTENTQVLGLNAHLNDIVLYSLYLRKWQMIQASMLYQTKKPRTITLKPHEAKALYEELRHTKEGMLSLILCHLDRALINQGFNNQQ